MLPPNHSNSLDAEDAKLLDALPDQGPLISADPAAPDDSAAPAPAPAAPAPSPAPAPAATPAPTPAAPAASPAPAASAAPAPSPASSPAPSPAPAEPRGDLRKALRASRMAEQRTREQLAEAQKQLQELQAANGQPQVPDVMSYTDEQLEDMRENFPSQYATTMELRRLKEENDRLRSTAPAPAPTPDTWVPTYYEPKVQAVIDAVPELAAWQESFEDQDKFNLAAEYDEALRRDPDWKGRTAVERFTEAARRVQLKTGQAPAPSPAPSIDPKAAIAAAEDAGGPKGIGDFRGGAPADAPAHDFRKMSDTAIFASLDAQAGTR